MKTPRTESVVRMAVGPMREYAIIEHAQNLECENISMRLALEDEDHAHELCALAQLMPGEGIDDGVNRIHAFLSDLANTKVTNSGAEKL